MLMASGAYPRPEGFMPDSNSSPLQKFLCYVPVLVSKLACDFVNDF